jgi:hypothetical protein
VLLALPWVDELVVISVCVPSLLVMVWWVLLFAGTGISWPLISKLTVVLPPEVVELYEVLVLAAPAELSCSVLLVLLEESCVREVCAVFSFAGVASWSGAEPLSASVAPTNAKAPAVLQPRRFKVTTDVAHCRATEKKLRD